VFRSSQHTLPSGELVTLFLYAELEVLPHDPGRLPDQLAAELLASSVGHCMADRLLFEPVECTWNPRISTFYRTERCEESLARASTHVATLSGKYSSGKQECLDLRVVTGQPK
jgi:hypothetical protein